LIQDDFRSGVDPDGMPEEPKRRRFAAPGARRFAAGALATFVAVFGVLALRVHDGDDPALASVAKKATAATTTTSTTSSAASAPSDDSPPTSAAVTATPGASTSAS